MRVFLGLWLLVALSASSVEAAPSTQRDSAPPAEKPAVDEVSPDSGPFVVTKDTDVRLDGQPCSYAAVPSDAIVVKMQVGADRRTVVRMDFRSR